jgi:signal transduction histidine kinase
MSGLRVLGIETSCDETAAAVVTDAGDVLSDVVRSQIAIHAPYGGVVPEIASRDHARTIVAVVREALANVARHAHAGAASVTVSAGNDIVLVIEDDGVGSAVFEREGGHGVANLRERARVLGGTASITAASPKGTRVEWRVPTR